MKITDDMVERACQSFGGITSPDWDTADDWEKEQVRGDMCRALEAVFSDPVIASLQADAWDEGFREGQRHVRRALRR